MVAASTDNIGRYVCYPAVCSETAVESFSFFLWDKRKKVVKMTDRKWVCRTSRTIGCWRGSCHFVQVRYRLLAN